MLVRQGTGGHCQEGGRVLFLLFRLLPGRRDVKIHGLQHIARVAFASRRLVQLLGSLAVAEDRGVCLGTYCREYCFAHLLNVRESLKLGLRVARHIQRCLSCLCLLLLLNRRVVDR